jgi:hypothetical protein
VKSVIDGFRKVCIITINNDGPAAVETGNNTAKRCVDNRKRRDIMGDKGGKKDKEKGQKQNADKQKQKSRNKLDKQPKRKP